MPFPEPNNLTGIVDWMRYGSDVTEGLFAPLILLSVYVISFLYMRYSSENSTFDTAMYAGFFTFMLTLIFRLSQITTNNRYIIISLALIVVPLAFYGYLTK